MPEIPECYLEVYLGFMECDRDGMSGALGFQAMNAVIDRYELTDLDEFEVRQLWLAMDKAARDRIKELKPDG